MKTPKFNISDIIIPNKKGISNYKQLKHLVKLQVTHNDIYPEWSRKLIECKILEGNSIDIQSYRSYFYKEIIQLFEQDFDLEVSTDVDYLSF